MYTVYTFAELIHTFSNNKTDILYPLEENIYSAERYAYIYAIYTM